jgi:hypothetical protein
MQLDIFSGGVSSSAVKGKSWRLSPLKSRIKASYKCQACGIRFHPKRYDRLKFCTRECSRFDRKRKAEEVKSGRKARYEKWLSEQQPIWEAKRAERKAKLLLAKEATELRHSQKPCRHCSSPRGFRVDAGWWGQGFCSSSCSTRYKRASPSGKVHRRARRKARKLKLRCLTVEMFDPVEVLQRDGWRCHICKVSTPSRLRGTYKPNAPELDHIVPIAAGGDHSRVNTACICRRCNADKGSRPIGQLRLVG